MTAEQAISWLTLKPKNLPVFVLLGTDPLASDVVDYWMLHARAAGVRPEKILAASNVSFDMECWPDKKLPG